MPEELPTTIVIRKWYSILEQPNSAATGLKVKSAAAASSLAVSVVSSGSNENLTVDAKGSGTITLNFAGGL